MSKATKAMVVVLVAALAALIYWAVQNVPKAPENNEPDQHIMTYNSNTITETKNGKVVWEMTADDIQVVAETKMATLTNVKCKYYTEDGRTVGVQGDEALYNQATGDAVLKDNISGESTDGYKFSCATVTWGANEKKLTLEGKVKMSNDEQKMNASGDKMEATDDFKKFKITGKAHMDKNMPKVE